MNSYIKIYTNSDYLLEFLHYFEITKLTDEQQTQLEAGMPVEVDMLSINQTICRNLKTSALSLSRVYIELLSFTLHETSANEMELLIPIDRYKFVLKVAEALSNIL